MTVRTERIENQPVSDYIGTEWMLIALCLTPDCKLTQRVGTQVLNIIVGRDQGITGKTQIAETGIYHTATLHDEEDHKGEGHLVVVLTNKGCDETIRLLTTA